jgi:hemerythrin-like domain-containing protein
MYIVHIMFRREFALLPGLVEFVSDQDTERAKIVTEHISLLNTLLLHHHEAEDTFLWPILLTHAPEEVNPVVHLVQGQHKRIDALLDDINARLAAFAGGAARAERSALADALRRLAVLLFEHMGLEEQLVLPIVERHVFASEWQAMEEHAVGTIDSQIVPLVFGMVLYDGAEEIVPEPLRAEILRVAPQAYADYAERVYGTRTPPRAKDVVIGTPFVGVAAWQR